VALRAMPPPAVLGAAVPRRLPGRPADGAGPGAGGLPSICSPQTGPPRLGCPDWNARARTPGAECSGRNAWIRMPGSGCSDQDVQSETPGVEHPDQNTQTGTPGWEHAGRNTQVGMPGWTARVRMLGPERPGWSARVNIRGECPNRDVSGCGSQRVSPPLKLLWASCPWGACSLRTARRRQKKLPRIERCGAKCLI
jgi:hypothetical protein